jgi:hypothetical protein
MRIATCNILMGGSQRVHLVKHLMCDCVKRKRPAEAEGQVTPEGSNGNYCFQVTRLGC